MTKGASVITMTYTADGEKLTKAMTGGGATKNYVSGIEYSGANTEAIYNAEGRLSTTNNVDFSYEYTLKDHLGNARVSFRAVTNGTAIQTLQENHYYPFGMEMEGPWLAQVGVENQYQYNGKELNEDFGLNLMDYGARWYDGALGRWGSVDPLAEKYKKWSPYNYGMNNPVMFIDPDGMAPVGPGPSWWRTTKFSIAHPLAAATIGYVSPGATNISTNSARFSSRGASSESKSSVLEEPKAQNNEGSQVNAFRHVLWQASISKEFDSDIAKGIGLAHEENPNAINGKSDERLGAIEFKSVTEADESIDLANNILGRSIGESNKNSGMRDMALNVLDAFHGEGLWTATKIGDGVWKMTKTKITDEQYNELKSVFQNLNNDGFTKEEQQKRNEAARKEQGHVIK